MTYGKIELDILELRPEERLAEEGSLWKDFVLYLRNGGDFLHVFVQENNGKFLVSGRERYFQAAKLLKMPRILIAIQQGADSLLAQSLVSEGKLELFDTRELLKMEQTILMRSKFFLYCFDSSVGKSQINEIEVEMSKLFQQYGGEITRILIEDDRLGFKASFPPMDGMWKHDYIAFLLKIHSIAPLRSIDGEVPALLAALKNK